MKKILYGTTALLAAGMFATSAVAAPATKAAPAKAAPAATKKVATNPIQLSVGGYANWMIGYADNDIDGDTARVNDFGTLGDAEVHFKGETKLDNGLVVGAKVELEADTRGDTEADGSGRVGVDQTYVYVGGAFGRIYLGAFDNVNKMMVSETGAKDVGVLDIQETDLTRFIIDDSAASYASEATWISNATDSNSIGYVSPEMYGFRLGANYYSNADVDSLEKGPSPVSLDNAAVVSLGYNIDLGKGMGLGVVAGFGAYKFNGTATETSKEYSGNVAFTFDGFSIGAGYKGTKDVGGENGMDVSVINASVAYEQGPYAASIAYSLADDDNLLDSTGAVAGGKINTLLASVKYNLGAGVDTFASVGYRKIDDANKGWAIITGLALTF